MKPHEIEVGKTYRNKGKGTTRRKVLAMRDDLSCGGGKDVQYMQVGGPWNGSEAWLQLASFAAWAGSEVKEGDGK